MLRPLFTTSFLIDDFLADNAFFGAGQLLLSSASSKTAYGTAFCLAQRRGTPAMPAVIGLTSAGNLEFTRSLDCLRRRAPLQRPGRLDPRVPTLYVDFAGNAALRRAIHEHFGAALVYSCSIGGTHWTSSAPAAACPGRARCCSSPRRRSSGAVPHHPRAGAVTPCSSAWAQLGSVHRSCQPCHAPWLHIVDHAGAPALQAAYSSLLEGRADARTGMMLALQSAHRSSRIDPQAGPSRGRYR